MTTESHSSPKHRQLEHKDHLPTAIKFPLAIMLDGVGDAFNVGSAFRIADALGVERVYLVGDSPCPPNKNITKTARNTDTVIPWEYQSSPQSAISAARKAGYQIISLELTNDSIPISAFTLDSSKPICLIAGAENGGVSQEILEESDVVLHIPMLGLNSSMNVATALAIVTYQLTTQLNPQ
jgi:tRNA G18 (ribose-2'-O)-methylase SpoU